MAGGRAEAVWAILDRMERTRLVDGGASATYRETYHPFLLGAFLFALLQMVLSSTLLRVLP